jgi:hypothetical protein
MQAPRYHIRTLTVLTAAVAVTCWALVLLIEHGPTAAALPGVAAFGTMVVVLSTAYTGPAVWALVRTVIFTKAPTTAIGTGHLGTGRQAVNSRLPSRRCRPGPSALTQSGVGR